MEIKDNILEVLDGAGWAVGVVIGLALIVLAAVALIFMITYIADITGLLQYLASVGERNFGT